MKEIKRIGELEKKYILEVLEGQFSSKVSYKMVTRLEKEFAAKFGVKHAIAMVNGTATLHMGLEAAGVGMGDEVICPPLTMSSTSFAILQANAIPVFADVDRDTFLITAEEIEKKITDKTKAIITVSLYGLSPDMEAIMAVAKKHNLIVIEDNAECFLAKQNNKYVGTYGDMASFSFQSSKHMTAGEGGIIITDNDDLALKLRKYSGLGYAGIDCKKGRITKEDIQDPTYERHVVLGWNYRMADLCGAVALAQLERLDELVEMRVLAAKHILDATKGCEWLIPQTVPANNESSYWTVVFVLDTNKVDWYEFRNKFVELGGDGIYAAWRLSYLESAFTKKHFLHREKIVDMYGDYEYKEGLCPNAEYLQPRLLQFKTNYWNEADGIRQADILKDTIAYFNQR